MPKIKMLFLCTGNSCRSQMAEGWARRLKGEQIEPYSAGIETHGLNPDAVLVMAEAGVDISGRRSKLVSELSGVDFDYVVTVCDNAHESCPVFHGKGQGRPRWVRRSAAAGGRRQDRRRAIGPLPPGAGRNPRVCGGTAEFPRTIAAWRDRNEQGSGAKRQAFLPGSLPYSLDIPGNGGWRSAGPTGPRGGVVD